MVSWFYALTYNAQNVIDGMDNLDLHIRGNDLHRRCYDQLQQRWLLWSGGHHVAIQDTTLRGLKIHAAIAGKDFIGPVQECDTILHFFMKPVVVGLMGNLQVQSSRSCCRYRFGRLLPCDGQKGRVYELDENSITIHRKVCTHDLVIIDTYCSQHSTGNRRQ